jgi:hypothetical protein
LIEIKYWAYWKAALGQVLAYSRFYPDHKKIVYFIGVPLSLALMYKYWNTLKRVYKKRCVSD